MATLSRRGVIGSAFGALLYGTLLGGGIWLGLQASGPKVLRLEWERVVEVEKRSGEAWAPSRELRREGRHPAAPRWPALDLGAGERERARRETYRAVVEDRGERTVEMPHERWSKLEPGERLER